jgi:hypothetical protein
MLELDSNKSQVGLARGERKGSRCRAGRDTTANRMDRNYAAQVEHCMKVIPISQHDIHGFQNKNIKRINKDADGDDVIEELDADAVGVKEGIEELEPVFTKVATGGPGNGYSIGGLYIYVAISDALDQKLDNKT